MQFVHAFMRVLVFVLHPTSCPRLGLSSSTTWWRKSRRRRKRGRGEGGQGGGCEGIRQPVPSLPSSPRLALCDLITRPLVGTAALMLPGPANKFAFPSSKGKTATPMGRMRSTAHYVCIIYVCMQMWRRARKWLGCSPVTYRWSSGGRYPVSRGATKAHFHCSVLLNKMLENRKQFKHNFPVWSEVWIDFILTERHQKMLIYTVHFQIY